MQCEAGCESGAEGTERIQTSVGEKLVCELCARTFRSEQRKKRSRVQPKDLLHYTVVAPGRAVHRVSESVILASTKLSDGSRAYSVTLASCTDEANRECTAEFDCEDEVHAIRLGKEFASVTCTRINWPKGGRS